MRCSKVFISRATAPAQTPTPTFHLLCPPSQRCHPSLLHPLPLLREVAGSVLVHCLAGNPASKTFSCCARDLYCIHCPLIFNPLTPHRRFAHATSGAHRAGSTGAILLQLTRHDASDAFAVRSSCVTYRRAAANAPPQPRCSFCHQDSEGSQTHHRPHWHVRRRP